MSSASGRELRSGRMMSITMLAGWVVPDGSLTSTGTVTRRPPADAGAK